MAKAVKKSAADKAARAKKQPATARAGATSTQQKPGKPPKPATAQVRPGTGRRVRATKVGYYDHTRRRVGDVFSIAKAEDFSDKWMEYVDPRTPSKVTTPNEAIAKEHDDILALRRGASRPGQQTAGGASGEDEIEDTGENPLGE